MLDSTVFLLILLLAYVTVEFMLLPHNVENTPNKGLELTIEMLLHALLLGTLLYFLRDNVELALGGSAMTLLVRLLAGTVLLRLGLTSTFLFITRQGMFLALLIGVWLISEQFLSRICDYLSTQANTRNLLVILAYLLVLSPASVLIGSILSPMLKDIAIGGSLKNAGRLIGYLERSLILTFVLLGQWEAVGFLLTAKSILRFNEIQGAEHRPLSEYVLVGTLLSFSISIGIGLIVVLILDL
ncbi:hypothetical protein HX857_25805 [Pseudomonas gingeri]|uniref:hypothetical protein n=1 Tax=Pseudomonas gingeri TaxID=117681 RepID=UPI0015C078D0|nr:hypothetical protein [Pseudomonas gingeri]NWE72123.1 hypothetical protein [Pseudomonas gingeri]